MENTANIQQSEKAALAKENQELDYWQKEFGISKDELLETVNKGGTSSKAVEKFVKELQVA